MTPRPDPSRLALFAFLVTAGCSSASAPATSGSGSADASDDAALDGTTGGEGGGGDSSATDSPAAGDTAAPDDGGKVDAAKAGTEVCGPAIKCVPNKEFCIITGADAGDGGDQTWACEALPTQCQGSSPTCACLLDAGAGTGHCPCSQPDGGKGGGLTVTCG